MRKTKIVCTLGPAVDSPEMMEKLMINGMDVARINFSHGTHEEHKVRIDNFKKVRDKVGKPVPLMLDTKGPEIRVKQFENGFAEIKEGQSFVFTTEDITGSSEKVSVTYEKLPQDIKAGDRILADDGLLAFSVDRTTTTDVICTALNSGKISDRKSINIPGAAISMPYLSKRDVEDICFGIENGVDIIAASFVRCACDVLDIKRVLEDNNADDIMIIAKIENNQGVDNIDEILKVSNGIMVARGDMGVEIPFEELPEIQKLLIRKCYSAGKVVITATQMLDSMIRNPRPTRAETSDVANAIYDGTSAIMLSGETAVGKYPVEAVATMAKIAEKTEGNINYIKRFLELKSGVAPTVTDAISHAACTTAHDLGAVAILTVTKRGTTARMLSKFRPACPIIATTTSERMLRQLSMSWGVFPLRAEEKYTTDELFDHAVDLSLKAGYVKNGDLVVITAGIPVGISGNTNILKAHLVGHVLVQGSICNDLSVSGNLCVAKTEDDAIRDFKDGDILVIPKTSNKIIDLLKHASGIITEEEGTACHGAIVGITLNIPVITGAKGAVRLLKSGTTVTMDGAKGLVYSGVVKI